MLYIIRFLCGFVRVRVSGDGSERIFNILNKYGVSVWSISGIGRVIEFNIFMRDYLNMIAFRHRLDPKISIKLIHKRGLPIHLKRLFAKPGIIVGVCLYFVICYFLSQYIWLIDIKGNVSVSGEDILSACSEIGVHCGIEKSGIDTYNLPQKFAMELENIAWASFNIEGSKLTVNISEANESEKDNSDLPRNIVASFDGVIKKLEISAGKKLVDVGDVVTKGDLMVSGFIEYGTNLHAVRAAGKVVAETRREFTEKIPKKQTVTVGDCTIVTRNALEIFGAKIPLYLSGVDSYKSSYRTAHYLSLFGTELPIGFTQRVYFLPEEKQTEVNSDMALSLAKSKVAENLRDLQIYEVLSHDTRLSEESDCYIVKISIVSSENISEYVDLQIVSD